MARDLTAGNASLGTSAGTHLAFLVHRPQRLLALRLAMARCIRPGQFVLDAGCGALGILSVLAAKLGAQVISVDLGSLHSAEQLAAANGVADRIRFVRGDLASLSLDDAPRFDVILGMVYNNHPVFDHGQQNLLYLLKERWGKPNAIVLPDRVTYTATPYDSPRDDLELRTAELATLAEQVSGYTELNLQTVFDEAVAGLPYRPFGAFVRDAYASEPVEFPVRHLDVIDKSDRSPLGPSVHFTTIDYAKPPTRYPENLRFERLRAGRLSSLLWRQDLWFGDQLIRTVETMSMLRSPRRIDENGSITITTGTRWLETGLHEASTT